MATEDMENNPFGGDGSNWTLLYVIIFSIPFIFVAIAIYSTWHDRRAAAAKAKNDLETGRAAKLDRYWHPWKYANEEAAAAAGSSSSSSTSSARKKVANPGNLTVVTTTTAASPAAGATSRHPSHNYGAAGRLTSPRGGGPKTSAVVAPITPWFAPPSQGPVNPYRPAHYQQHPPRRQQQSKKQSAASPYLPRPTAAMHDETEMFGDGSDLRYV
ncbi:uncharacterized protein PG998_007005 [Apiospora kogelbergensis]|uniref:Uncharacterized protein n=1 Tax=Apiospora kogelbergensis TaxID=1337665 RepID=A0AAW0QGX9_9PEZI